MRPAGRRRRGARDHLDMDRVDILAHSAAGDLAILYAARHPQRIRSMTLVAARARAIGIDVTVEHRREAVALRSAEPWFEPARRAFEAIGWGTRPMPTGAPSLRSAMADGTLRPRADDASSADQTNHDAVPVYPATGAFDPDTTRTAIGKLTAPVLIYAGELDAAPRPHVAEATARLFPRAEVVVQPGGGHVPWLDDPGHFTRTVVAFTSAASGRT
ncbi:MAG: alpha/beta fold hydrolase [Jiangellaceae bacterium]